MGKNVTLSGYITGSKYEDFTSSKNIKEVSDKIKNGLEKYYNTNKSNPILNKIVFKLDEIKDDVKVMTWVTSITDSTDGKAYTGFTSTWVFDTMGSAPVKSADKTSALLKNLPNLVGEPDLKVKGLPLTSINVEKPGYVYFIMPILYTRPDKFPPIVDSVKSDTSGTSGTNGTSGTSGTNGTSGTSGTNGSLGTSGTNGSLGNSGTDGTNGSLGTSGTEGTNGTSGTSGASKFKPTIIGIIDGFQITAKTDLPNFAIYVGDPEKWPVRENIEEEVGAGNAEDFENIDGADVIDDEYMEMPYGDGENLLNEEESKEDQLLAEESAKILEKTSVDSNPVGTTTQNAKNIPVNSLLPEGNLLIPPGFNNVPIYGQSDTRWAKKKYDWNKSVSCGDGSTVKSSGCGPSAVSMVINFWASKGYCDPVTPDIVAKFFADFGGRVCGAGTGLGNVPKDKFKDTFGIVIKVGSSEADLVKALKAGYPCVISGSQYSGYNFKGKKMTGKYPGHVVCLTGIDAEGRIRVNDSGNMPSGGKAITAFFEGKSIGQSTLLNQRAIFWPASMSSPV